MRINMGNAKASAGLGGNLGGTVTGPLILAADPTQPFEAATKQYVDNTFSNLDASTLTGSILPDSTMPEFIGDISKPVGSTVISLNQTGIAAGTYSKVTVDATGRVTFSYNLDPVDVPQFSWNKVINHPTTLAGYGITDALSLAGGTVTANITITGSISNPLHAATKQYVDNSLTTILSLQTGDIVKKTTSVTPTGFLRCNGAIVSQTTYSALYAVIGNTYNPTGSGVYPGSGKPWKQQYEFNANTATDLSAWTTTTNFLPIALKNSQAIVTKNRVYLLGGYDGANYLSSVHTAPINPDGTLGAWTTSTSLPGPLGFSQVIVTKNRVYLLGGFDGVSYLSSVHTAPINTDGTLGAWTTSTPLPGSLGYSQAIVTKNRVYLLGGFDGISYLFTVYTAPINTDGTLGTWTTSTNSLPVRLGYSQAIVTSSRVYLLGGIDNTGYTSAVHTAPINTDGTLGTWSTSVNSLPGTLGNSQAIVTSSRVYLLGGFDSANYLSIVYTAPINVDGTLGTWTTSANTLPTVLSNSQAIVTSSRIYLLGGWDGWYSLNVYETPFTGGLDDYSPYYDGTYAFVQVAGPGEFKLPDTTSIDSQETVYRYIKY